MAHPKPAQVVNNRIKNTRSDCSNIKKNRQTIKAIAIGVKQYPSTQTDWKNELKVEEENQKSGFEFFLNHKQTYIFPPSNLEFKVTTRAPIQTSTKTSAN